MIDLHVHTNCSDGDFDVKEVLNKAEKQGVKFLSITDHDSVMAYEQLEDVNIKKYYSGTLIKGIEMTFLYDDLIMEMLGYNIDINVINEIEFIKHVAGLDNFKIQCENLEKIINVCDNLGIKYSKNLKITSANNEANDVLLDDIIKYPENKEVLGKMGINDRSTFYRKHFCNGKSPFYVDLKKGLPTIKEVCQGIKNSGGKCFLAHIYTYRFDNTEEILKEMIDLNILDGIECYHKKHSVEQAKFLENICKENNLLISGGSDFHRDDTLLGHYNRDKDVIPERIMENLGFNK